MRTPDATDSASPTVGEILAKLGVNPKTGSNPADLQERLTKYGPNALAEEKKSALAAFVAYFWGADSLDDRGCGPDGTDRKRLGQFCDHRITSPLQRLIGVLGGTRGLQRARRIERLHRKHARGSAVNRKTLMSNYLKKLIVQPGSKIRLKHFDPGYHGKHESRKSALPEIEENRQKMQDLHYLMYAENKHSLLIVLQGLDAGGKDGVVRHVLTGMNPSGCIAVNFKQPTAEDLAHDFLWRVHPMCRPKARSQFSIARITKMCWSRECTASCRKKSGRSATTKSTISKS